MGGSSIGGASTGAGVIESGSEIGVLGIGVGLGAIASIGFGAVSTGVVSVIGFRVKGSINARLSALKGMVTFHEKVFFRRRID